MAAKRKTIKSDPLNAEATGPSAAAAWVGPSDTDKDTATVADEDAAADEEPTIVADKDTVAGSDKETRAAADKDAGARDEETVGNEDRVSTDDEKVAPNQELVTVADKGVASTDKEIEMTADKDVAAGDAETVGDKGAAASLKTQAQSAKDTARRVSQTIDAQFHKLGEKVEQLGQKLAPKLGIDTITSRSALGGQLEFFGGDLGRGRASIRLFGPEERFGFFAPSGGFVALETDFAAIDARPDLDEHRWLSAAGWGLAFGTLAGPAGIVLGGGIRLINPRRMIFEGHLQDGRRFVARTDKVTVRGLEALCRQTESRPH